MRLFINTLLALSILTLCTEAPQAQVPPNQPTLVSKVATALPMPSESLYPDPVYTAATCLSDEALQGELAQIRARAELELYEEVTFPDQLPTDGSDLPEVGPLSYFEQKIISETGEIVTQSTKIVLPEAICAENPYASLFQSSGDEDPAKEYIPPPQQDDAVKRKPCCFYTYSDEQSGGGTYHRGDNHSGHASAFKWPISCAGRIFNCALNAKTNPFSVRFCEHYDGKKLVKTYKSMPEAAEALQCGRQRHLTLYHANPEWGMRMLHAVKNACFLDNPINLEHINMGCSTFGDPKAICKAASDVVSTFKKRCDKPGFSSESAVFAGNIKDNWMPGGLRSCSWGRPDGDAANINVTSVRRIIANKSGFIACRLKDGKWVNDPKFCEGSANYLPKESDSLKCDNSPTK